MRKRTINVMYVLRLLMEKDRKGPNELYFVFVVLKKAENWGPGEEVRCCETLEGEMYIIHCEDP